MRLPTIKREDLSPENQERWDRITAGRTGGGGGGPYSALIYAPLLADLLAQPKTTTAKTRLSRKPTGSWSS
jgi:hypothetical protein